jgi:hypothetical protein
MLGHSFASLTMPIRILHASNRTCEPPSRSIVGYLLLSHRVVAYSASKPWKHVALLLSAPMMVVQSFVIFCTKWLISTLILLSKRTRRGCSISLRSVSYSGAGCPFSMGGAWACIVLAHLRSWLCQACLMLSHSSRLLTMALRTCQMIVTQ